MKKTFMVSAASLLIALGACTSFEEVKQQADKEDVIIICGTLSFQNELK